MLLEISTIIVAIANISLGIVVFIKMPRSRTHQLFSLFCFFIFAWVVTNYFALVSEEKGIALVLMRSVMALVTAQATVVLLFSITFPSRSFTIKKRWIVLIIAAGLISVVICFSPFVFSDVTIFEDGSAHLPVVAPGILLFAIITLGSIISAIVIALKRYRHVAGLIKLQLKYFVYGILLMYAGEVFFSFIMVVVFNNSSFVYLGSLFTLPFIFFTTYAIVKYRLLDIDVVIRRSVIHVISMLITIFLLGSLLYLIFEYAVKRQEDITILTLVAIVLTLSLLTDPLRKYFFVVFGKVFNKEQLMLTRELRAIKNQLSSQVEFEKHLVEIKKYFKERLGIDWLQFILHDKRSGKLENCYSDEKEITLSLTDTLYQYISSRSEIIITEEIPYQIEEFGDDERETVTSILKTLQQKDIGLLLPIGEKGELIGVFFFGKKKDNEAFTADDIDYLSKIQLQITNAIANALLYKQAVERITKE